MNRQVWAADDIHAPCDSLRIIHACQVSYRFGEELRDISRHSHRALLTVVEAALGRDQRGIERASVEEIIAVKRNALISVSTMSKEGAIVY